MLKVPTTTDDFLINQIMDEAEFFSKSQMLYFERNQIFQSYVITTHPPATNTDPPGTYAKLHPSYDPSNLSPQNIFRAGQYADPHEINYRLFQQNPSQTFFVQITSQQQVLWLISLPTTYMLFNQNSLTTQLFKKVKEVSIKGNNISFLKNDKEIKYPIKVNENGNLEFTVGYVQDVLTKAQQFGSFNLFFRSFFGIGGYPAVKPQIESYFRALVENVQFLLIFSSLRKSVPQPVVNAWLEAAGHNIISLVPLSLYYYFNSFTDPNLVFRQDSFLTNLLTKVIEKDQGMKDFLSSIDIQAEDLGEEFFTKFEQTELNPLSHFLLYHAFTEARRAFPTQGAEYYAVSGILFLRIMTPYLSYKNPGSSKRIATLTSLYNMTESKVGIEKVKRMKDMISRFEVFPDEFGIEKSPPTSLKSINVLMQFINENAQAFYDLSKTIDVKSIADKYYTVMTGKAPIDDGPVRDQPPDFDEPSNEYSGMESELSNLSQDD